MIAVLWIYAIATLLSSLVSFGLHAWLSQLEQDLPICLLDAKDLLERVMLISWTLLWYSISISFTLFNKWFLNVFYGGFPFPILVTGESSIISILNLLFALYCFG